MTAHECAPVKRWYKRPSHPPLGGQAPARRRLCVELKKSKQTKPRRIFAAMVRQRYNLSTCQTRAVSGAEKSHLCAGRAALNFLPDAVVYQEHLSETNKLQPHGGFFQGTWALAPHTPEKKSRRQVQHKLGLMRMRREISSPCVFYYFCVLCRCWAAQTRY